MRRNAQRWDVVVFGDIGYDAYLLSDSECVVRPAGSAYNIGYGLLASRASGSLIASVPERFDRRQLDVFKRGAVRVVEQAVDPRLDQLYLFDMRNGPTDVPTFLGTTPLTPGADLQTGHMFAGGIVHIGTMKPGKAVRIAEHIRESGATKSSIISANFYLSYLKEDREACLGLLSMCELLFMNAAEFEALSGLVGQQALCHSRTLVVSSGAAGATLVVDGVAVFHYTPKIVQPVCTVGAGDVLIGAFLGAFAQTENPSLALAYACEAAARSTSDYGVARCMDAFADFHSAKEVLPLIDGATLGFASIADLCIEIAQVGEAYDKVEATGLFVIRGGELLLIDKVAGKELEKGVKYVPGGKLEPGETPEQCARRELQEETTLGIAEIELVSIFTYLDSVRRRAYKFYQFLITPTAGTAEPRDDISAVHWTPLVQLDSTKLFGLTRAQIALLRIGRRLG
ncbi:MAG: NUDIX domain-containing protein [Thermomicrobiales bacterium]|nr:MAG: NUDIX domain-containing protein [Thermomicrobiales bacterium]